MNVQPETVHVVFGLSIAATLREALWRLGRAERVISLPDILSVGPIAPPDPGLRRAWNKSVLRADFMLLDEPGDETIDMEYAWAEATEPKVHPIYWACLNAPAEYACFLAFAARMWDRPFDFVDATNLDIKTRDGLHRLWSLGAVRTQEIVASDLYGRRRRLSRDERRAASEAWAELQRENAPFRVVQDGRLVSAPLTHYDALLVELASPDWEISARLIGRVMTAFEDASRGDGTGDAILFGRLLTLGEAGSLEITGPGPSMRDYQVRRPHA